MKTIRIKTQDNQIIIVDQQLSELYGWRDNQTPIPQVLIDAPRIPDNMFYVKGSYEVVQVNYPRICTKFTLSSNIGYNGSYQDLGKNAYIRNGHYNYKGGSVNIVLMSPKNYLEECVKVRRLTTSVEEYIEAKKVDYDVFEVFDQVDDMNYLVLDYADNQQEGAHRAIYCMSKSINLVPVIVIK